MKPNNRRILSVLLAAVFCMAAFALSVSADSYYSSDESGNTTPPDYIGSITIDTEGIGIETDSAVTVIEDEVDLDSFFDDLFNVFGGTDALTPVGNMTLIDDILQDESNTSVESMENEQKSKQFITVQTKNGNYFYIIIDRSGDTENVYFLNLVDEADLFALLETDEETTTEETEPVPVCVCQDKCITGSINTDCEVCTVKMKDCIGKEVMQTEPVPEPEEPEMNSSALLIIILLVAAGGGAAVYFLKFRKNETKTAGTTDLDDYDYGEDEDEIEYESENEEDTIA